MKALLTLALALSFAHAAFAVTVKADLNGQATEVQQTRQTDGHKSISTVGAAQLNEIGRTGGSEIVIYLNAESIEADYQSVLHNADTVSLTLDTKTATVRGSGATMNAKVQILGDDDQFRKAEGKCLVSADGVECALTPTSNAFGLLENTQLNLSLK